MYRDTAMWIETFNSRLSLSRIDRRLFQTALVKKAFVDVINILFS